MIPSGRAPGQGEPHVVFVNRFFHPDESATSQLLSDLAVWLARDGMAVEVVASRLRFDDAAAGLPRRECVAGVRVTRCRTTRFGRLHTAGRALDYLSFLAAASAAVLARSRPGTIVVAMSDPPLLGSALRPVVRLRGARLVNWWQDVFPDVALALGMLRGGAGLLGRARDRLLRAAAANVAIGDRMAGRLCLAVPEARVDVIPNWALPADAAPDGKADLRTEWGLAGKFVVGYSGNLGRAHEFDTLLAAARELRERTDIAFLLVGDGYHRAGLEARCRAAGLANVTFRPYQPRALLAASLASADAHLVSLLPALEGLIVPSKLYGILSAGRPVLFVGDPAGEVGTIVTRHHCGVAVPVGDGAALASAVRRLADEPDLAANLGRRGRELADGLLSREAALRRWRDLLREVHGG